MLQWHAQIAFFLNNPDPQKQKVYKVKIQNQQTV